MLSMFSNVVNKCDKEEQLFNLFKDRLNAIVEESYGIGWGYHDGLCELYYSIEWTFDEEE